jgi:hypothetical protein
LLEKCQYWPLLEEIEMLPKRQGSDSRDPYRKYQNVVEKPEVRKSCP